MKKIQLLLFMIALVVASNRILASVQTCSNDKKSLAVTQDTNIRVHPVIYLDDNIEVITDTLDRNNKEYVISVNTYRNYWELLDYFKQQFGTTNYKAGVSTTDSVNGFGKYRWPHINALGLNDLEFTLYVNQEEAVYKISLDVWSEKLEDIANTKGISAFFVQACRNHLFNQKIIFNFTEEGHHFDKYFDFQELIQLNYDSLVTVYEKFLTLNDDMINVNLTIDEKGEIYSDETVGNKEVRIRLDTLFKSLDFPIFIYKNLNDTVKYHLSWDFWISDKTFTERAKNLIKSGTKNYLPLFSYPSKKRRGKYYIMKHDFFKIGKKIYLIRNPHGKGIAFYDFANGKFEELFLNTDFENEFFDQMYYEDLNNDSINELIFQNSPNMNGNSWKKVYAYNKSKNEIYCAGEFSTSETFNKAKNEIYVDYSGSWYMPISRRVLGWKNGKLITKRFIEITLKDGDRSEDDKEIMEYYENPFFESGIDTLVLKKTDWYSDKYKPLWDNFFKTISQF